MKSVAGDDVDPRRFPWLEPPPSEAIERATWRLRQHGALRADERLTPLGSFLASLPVDACVGKLLALGAILGLAGPIATVAAGLSTRAPFARGFGAGADAAERTARAPFDSPHGDPFTRLVAFAGGRARGTTIAWTREDGVAARDSMNTDSSRPRSSRDGSKNSCAVSGTNRPGGGTNDSDADSGKSIRRRARGRTIRTRIRESRFVDGVFDVYATRDVVASASADRACSR